MKACESCPYAGCKGCEWQGGVKTGPRSRSAGLGGSADGDWSLEDLAPLQRAINETLRRLAEVTETYTFPPQAERGAERRAEGER